MALLSSLFSLQTNSDSNSKTNVIYKACPYFSTFPRDKKVQTPSRFWPWFDEDEFEDRFESIASGHFGEVKKAWFRTKEYLHHKDQPIIYASQLVAIKDPKGRDHDCVMETYILSNEVSCTLILHPNIINYIGGVYLRSPGRIGIVMEFVENNLRNVIKHDRKLKDRRIQLFFAKQISSGMNFLHSLNPSVLHGDLRTPNILITNKLECKIADFGLAINFVYENSSSVLYTSLIPPECEKDPRKFSKKGDIYFYGWILIEMLLRKKPKTYSLDEIQEVKSILQASKEIKYLNLILSLINQDENKRPNFNQILSEINSLLGFEYDIELIAQNNSTQLLKKGIEEKKISEHTVDSFGRNLIFQCCIFGNLEMLKYCVKLWGKKYLNVCDKHHVTLGHVAARNGYLNILQYLESEKIDLNVKEIRFQTTPLNLSIAMKHSSSIDFLIKHANQETLDSSLQASSQEGILELVNKLIDAGANIEYHSHDIGATVLDRASYNGHTSVVAFLIEKGALVNQKSKDGRTPIWNVAQNGHYDIAKLLIESGAEVNLARNTDGATPLLIAIVKGHENMIDLLLSKGASIHQECNGRQIGDWVQTHANEKIKQIVLKYYPHLSSNSKGTK